MVKSMEVYLHSLLGKWCCQLCDALRSFIPNATNHHDKIIFLTDHHFLALSTKPTSSRNEVLLADIPRTYDRAFDRGEGDGHKSVGIWVRYEWFTIATRGAGEMEDGVPEVLVEVEWNVYEDDMSILLIYESAFIVLKIRISKSNSHLMSDC